MSERPLIVSVGQVGMHCYAVVPHLPVSERPVHVDEISLQVGGSAAIAAGTAAAMGCDSRLVCKLADDFMEQFILRATRDAGIETCGVLDKDRRLSPIHFIAIGKRNGQKRVFQAPGDAGELSLADIDPAVVLDGASALLLDGHDGSAQIALAQQARERGIPVIVDASRMGEGLGTLAALADVFICSERLAAELAQPESLEESLIEIQRLGPRTVIITLGASGSVGLRGDKMVEQQTFNVDVTDTSGAGSVFHGAFATALVGEERPFAQCMELASAAAALSCQKLGSWGGIPNHAQVLERIRGTTAH